MTNTMLRLEIGGSCDFCMDCEEFLPGIISTVGSGIFINTGNKHVDLSRLYKAKRACKPGAITIRKSHD